MSSSLVIYIGHSGDKIHAADQASRITSLDALRGFVEREAGIPSSKQVFLTAKGKQVRVPGLLTENEIYAFDSSLLAPLSSPAKETRKHLALSPTPTPYEPGKPPDSITNQTDLASWRTLFSTRLAWAKSLREACASLASRAQRHAEEQSVIEKSLAVAVMSLTSHMRGAEQKHRAAEGWSEDLLRQQEGAVDHWESDLARLARIPARGDFTRFVLARDPAATSVETDDGTLLDFVDMDEVHEAGARARDIMTSFAQRVVGLRANLTATGKAGDELLSAVEQMRQAGPSASAAEGPDEPAKLTEEIDLIVTKMHNDLEHVSSLPQNSQGVSRASKMALLHTRNYLPNLHEFCGEINDLVRRIIEARNAAAENSMSHMQTLAGVESRLGQIYAEIKNVDISQDDQHAFNLLNIISRLPYVYGSLLIEAVRRREWILKMKKDSATLAEEMATFQEEEARRRKKWLLSIDDVVNPDLVNAKPIGTEINLHTDEEEWPVVSRKELQDYLDRLGALDLPPEVVQDLTDAVKDLDRPTKKQVRLAKNAFKNGSVHEAAFGTTSLLLRGGDEHKLLRDVNVKLEDELRGQKSRVRKLEDLLHRQAHLQRAASGQGQTQADSASAFSPTMELVSTQQGTPPLSSTPFNPRGSEDAFRQVSVGSIGSGSRRTSTTLTTEIEEKRLARRIVSLEAELLSVKEHSALLEQERTAFEKEKSEFEALKRKSSEDEGSKLAQFEEAVSTKKDIMENMEAQQREFADERRVLEEELRVARSRAEEIEDEIERVLGSRSQVDTKTRELEHELDLFKQHADDEDKKRAEEIKELKRQVLDLEERAQQDRQELQEARRRAQEAESARIEQDQAYAESNALLATAYKHLSPANQPPEKYTDLVPILEDLARRATDHAKELSENVQILQSDKKSLETQQEALNKDLSTASANASVLDAEVIRLRDEMAAEKAHTASLSSCLDDERAQLRDLRSKIAMGETGADLLRKRVEDEEGKVVSLTEKLADAQSHNNSLDVELMRVQKKHNNTQRDLLLATERLDSRGNRAKEISQRLYAQNTRLLRLLDQLGFVVSHTEGRHMVIERASKANNAGSTMLDASMMQSRGFSSPPPMGSRKTSLTGANDSADPTTLSFLHWTDSPTLAKESTAYQDFKEHIDMFETSVFAEALSKRLRDFEYTARKHSKSSRQYQLLSQQYRRESLSKIAVRDFKEGDLALFLPTRGELGNKGAWAAFNIGAPHHFLREREGMGLARREWLVARIGRVEERVVDLKSGGANNVKGSGESFKSIGSTSVDAASLDSSRRIGDRDDDNPFELSDGLTWYLVHASEDKAGAPSTPGLGKATVSATSVDAKGSIRMGKEKKGVSGMGEAVKTLGNVKSLDSRRSSEASRKSVGVGLLGSAGSGNEARRIGSDTSIRGLGISSSNSPAVGSPTAAGEMTGELTKDDDREREEQQSHSHVRNSSSPLRPRPSQRTASPSKATTEGQQQHRRSSSPSKSIRSLARHLDTSSSRPPTSGFSTNNADTSGASIPTLSPSKRRMEPSVADLVTSRRMSLSAAGPGVPSTIRASPTKQHYTSARASSSSPRKGSAMRRGSHQLDPSQSAELPGELERPRTSGSGSGARPGTAGSGGAGERPGTANGSGGGGAGRKGTSLWNLFSVGGEYEL